MKKTGLSKSLSQLKPLKAEIKTYYWNKYIVFTYIIYLYPRDNYSQGIKNQLLEIFEYTIKFMDLL